jgi:nitrite reductase/ring-hydroxylating ferredoxin subunit
MQPAGTYNRDLGAPLARLIENALDWEHLPHVHANDFSSLNMVCADEWGWSAEVGIPGGGSLSLELKLDPDRLGWVTTSRSDFTVVSRIDSRAEATGSDTCRVSVNFFVPSIPPGHEAATASFFSGLYARLYDEDEAMMQARHTVLSRGASVFRDRRTVQLDDGVVVSIPTACPHLGLPLDAEPDATGIVTCPWHGYQFDVRTGQCVSGQRCGWQID